MPATLNKQYQSTPAIDHNKIKLEVKEPHDESGVDDKLLETLAKKAEKDSEDSRAADIDELSCNEGIEEEIGET